MQQLTIIIFLLVFSGFVHAENEFEEDIYSGIANVTFNSFCSDKKTLKYINKNSNQCALYIKLLSKKCTYDLSQAFPKFNNYDHAKKMSHQVKSLTRLYVACLKAELYESVEGVELLK